MGREQKTAAELGATLNRMIAEKVVSLSASSDRCIVPEPELLAKPDATGCNWMLLYFDGPMRYQKLVCDVVTAARTRYNLLR